MDIGYILIIVLVLLILLYIYGTLKNRHFEKLGVKSITPRLPFIGNMLGVVIRRDQPFLSLHKIYKAFPDESFVGFYEFSKPNLLIRDINLLKDIAVTDFDSFRDHRTHVDPNADELFGNFLINLKGNQWKDMRHILSPVFTSSKLKTTLMFFIKCGEHLVAHFEDEMQKCEKNGSNILEVDINDALKKYMHNVISSTSLGIECNSHVEPDDDITLHGNAIAALNLKQIILFFLHSSFPRFMTFFRISIYKSATIKFFNTLVHNLIDNREKQNIFRPDVIQLLLKAKKEMNGEKNGAISNNSSKNNPTKKWNEQIISAQPILFFMAGFHSTSIVTSFLIYEICKLPEVQKKLQDEVDEAIASGVTSFETISNMKYLDMVTKETLRMWPTVGCVDRECKNDYVIPEKYNKGHKPYKVKKNDCIWFPIFSIQHDPKNFHDPDRFDPERFSPENLHSFDPFAYIPFGVGPRKCIGDRYAILTMKVAVFYLVSKFSFEVIEKTPIPMIVDPKSLLIQSQNGYWVGMKKRQSNIAN